MHRSQNTTRLNTLRCRWRCRWCCTQRDAMRRCAIDGFRIQIFIMQTYTHTHTPKRRKTAASEVDGGRCGAFCSWPALHEPHIQTHSPTYIHAYIPFMRNARWFSHKFMRWCLWTRLRVGDWMSERDRATEHVCLAVCFSYDLRGGWCCAIVVGSACLHENYLARETLCNVKIDRQ